MSKHTPGPWELTRMDNAIGYLWESAEAENHR